MGLRTQVDPHVLIGDSLADLPAPGNIPQGTIFYEFATHQARVLVENSSTHVRSWQPLGAGGGGTGALYAYAGVRVAGQSGQERFLANDTGVLNTTLGDTGAATPPSYAVFDTFTTLFLRVQVRANSMVAPVLVHAVKNGIAGSPVASITYAGGATGPQAIGPLAVPFAAGDSIDVSVVLDPSEVSDNTIQLSAVVKLS